jgi:hypothetical protein
VNAHEVAEINEARRQMPPRALRGDHDAPYAPTPAVAYKLAAVLPVSSVLMADMPYSSPGDLWRAYWRRREFNELRHANPFPRFRPFRWLR